MKARGWGDKRKRPQTKEQSWLLETGKSKEPVSPLKTSEGVQTRPLILDFRTPGLQENTFVLFYVTQFLRICYSISRKLIHRPYLKLVFLQISQNLGFMTGNQ